MIPFLRSWVNNWDDFNALLKLQFKTVPGLGKITSGEYVFRDEAITRGMPVDAIFLPGRRITMSILFDVKKFAKSCPRCFAAASGNDVQEQTCAFCKVKFSHHRISRPEDDIKVNSGMPVWFWQPGSEGYPQVATEQNQQFPKHDSSSLDVSRSERMENFTRVRIVEIIGAWSKLRSREPIHPMSKVDSFKVNDAMEIVNGKGVGELLQTGDGSNDEHYILDVQSDPVLQWFRNLSRQGIIDIEGLCQMLEMDDDDNHDFSRSMYLGWRDDCVSRFDTIRRNW